jgi:hypothetical protein
VPRAIDKGNVSLQLPHFAILLEHVRGRRALRAVVSWDAVFGRVAFVDLGIGIPEEGGRKGGGKVEFSRGGEGFDKEGGRRGRRTYPSLIVIFRSSSGLVLTVFTPLIALTTVDFPWAT